MKGLALGVSVVLMAGVTAVADEPSGVIVFVDGEENAPAPASKSFTSADMERAAVLFPSTRLLDPASPLPPEERVRIERTPDVEMRLKAIEEKLDRILKELESIKGQPQASKAPPSGRYMYG